MFHIAAGFACTWITEVTSTKLSYTIPALVSGRKRKDKTLLCIRRRRIGAMDKFHPLDLLSRWFAYQNKQRNRPVYLFSLRGERNVKLTSITQNQWLREALKEIEYTPPPGRCIQAHGTRAGSSSCAFGIGVPIAVIKFHGDWRQDGATFETTYWDPSYVTTDNCHAWFGDMFPKLVAAPDWESVR